MQHSGVGGQCNSSKKKVIDQLEIQSRDLARVGAGMAFMH